MVFYALEVYSLALLFFLVIRRLTKTRKRRNSVLIEIKNVVKSFGETQVLKDISISIKKGEIYGIIGHSGAGKSTLLRCINGLESYNEGSVNVMGREVSSLKDSELREFRKDLGMIFQNFNLLQRKNINFNVRIIPFY